MQTGNEDLVSKFGSGSVRGQYPWRAVYVGLTIFLLIFLSYLGMEFGYKPFLEGNLEKIDERLGELSKSISAEEQEDLLLFYSQLINAENLLAEHRRPTSLFALLEANTLPSVYYKSVSLKEDAREIKLTIQGVATDYNTIAQQLELFRNAKGVVSVVLGKASREKENSIFQMILTLELKALLF